jgi:hypothetical protein
MLPGIFRCSVYLKIFLKTGNTLDSISCVFFQHSTLVYVSSSFRRLVVVRRKVMAEKEMSREPVHSRGKVAIKSLRVTVDKK